MARDLHLRRDDNVDRHVLAAEQIRPFRLQIILAAYARDLGRHLEQGMADLAGDHVHLVRIGDRDQHVGLLGTRHLQRAGMRGVANEGAHVERVVDLADQVRRLVDDGDVIALGGQIAGDAGANLPRAADNHVHGCCLSFRPGLRQVPDIRKPAWASVPWPVRPATSASGAARTVPYRRRPRFSRYFRRTGSPAPSDIRARTARAPRAAPDS